MTSKSKSERADRYDELLTGKRRKVDQRLLRDIENATPPKDARPTQPEAPRRPSVTVRASRSPAPDASPPR
ncbi:MAG: hypothetical protein JJU33_14860 [Phycisphaerales bacterium]|nr:hypothetical protein [Phycisphaerales bacterium]